MNWKQELVDSQTSVNRAVWAMNDIHQKSKAFSSDEERLKFIKDNVRSAIKELSNSIQILDNELKFEE